VLGKAVQEYHGRCRGVADFGDMEADSVGFDEAMSGSMNLWQFAHGGAPHQ
jgi:hypothetical protein